MDPPEKPSITARQAWAQACSRVAIIAGGFCLVLGTMQVVNSLRLQHGGNPGSLLLDEVRALDSLKARLREDPKNELLQKEIRALDQQVRLEFFRRKKFAARGAWALAGGAAVFLTALQAALLLKRPTGPNPTVPNCRNIPVRSTNAAAKAVSGSALALASLALACLWGTTPQWQGIAAASGIPSVETTAKGDEMPALTWFPSDVDIAANWPRFRGPDGSGISSGTGLPESWDGTSGTNVAWKTETELPGENSPVVWGDRVYLTGADADAREVYAYDATDGKLLWTQEVYTPQSDAAEAPEVMEETGFAAPTAATDGRRVFAIFANGDIAGFSSDGESLWVRSLGTPQNVYGHATSLALWRNHLIVVLDQGSGDAEKSRIMALDAVSGDPVWSTPRNVPNSWVSPILIRHAGREQIITSADPWVIAYDPKTGRELWRADCMEGDVAVSPVYANGLIYVASEQASLAAIKPDGTGDITKSGIVWTQHEAGLPDTCSLLCDGLRVYTLAQGTLHAFDALTGSLLWKHETGAKFDASPTLINGRIHLLSNKGVMIIGEADNSGFRESGRAELGEAAGASPAIAHGRIYLRGRKHLFCIANPDEP